MVVTDDTGIDLTGKKKTKILIWSNIERKECVFQSNVAVTPSPLQKVSPSASNESHHAATLSGHLVTNLAED